MRARTGFTLPEVLITSVILASVLAMALNIFVSMRQTQDSTAVGNLLKAGAQKAMHDIDMELSQCRKLLASSDLDPASKDLGKEYFQRMQGISSPPAVPIGNMLFPRIDANGGFGMRGTNSGELNANNIGNTLVFVAAGPTLALDRPGATIRYGSAPAVDQTLDAKPFYISSVRFVAYYLTEKSLPAGVAPIRLSDAQSKSSTLQLKRWESQPYMERGEFTALAGMLVGGNTAAKQLWDWMQAHPNPAYHMAGLWDSGAASVTDAFYSVNAIGSPVKMGTVAIARRRETKAVQIDSEPYALNMVAFNEAARYQFPDFDVPAYAPVDSAHVNYPYGFEVGIAGPTGARSVLVRLAMAARANMGQKLFGQAQQEIVKVVDM